MSPGLIDTNIFLYAANRDSDEYAAAREFLTRAAEDSGVWYVTEGIIYEFLRVSTHPRVFDRPLDAASALDFLNPILRSPDFRLLVPGKKHWRILEAELKELSRPSGNLFFDIRTMVLMREHGIHRIYTADRDFLQFPNLQVVDPLA